jgi:hypothetical protein
MKTFKIILLTCVIFLAVVNVTTATFADLLVLKIIHFMCASLLAIVTLCDLSSLEKLNDEWKKFIGEEVANKSKIMTQEQITKSRIAHYTEVLHDYLPSATQVEVTSAERVETECGVHHKVDVMVDGWSYFCSSTNYLLTLSAIADMHNSNVNH